MLPGFGWGSFGWVLELGVLGIIVTFLCWFFLFLF